MKVILILCFICGLNVYGQNDSCLLIKREPYKITLVQSNYKFQSDNDSDLLFGYDIPYGKSQKSKSWTPSKNQILSIDKNIAKFINDYKASSKLDASINNNLFDIIQKINDYNRQYFCCLNDKGEKILFVKFYIKTH